MRKAQLEKQSKQEDLIVATDDQFIQQQENQLKKKTGGLSERDQQMINDLKTVLKGKSQG